MDIQALKIELAKRLLDSDDLNLIEEIKSIFDRKEEDFWDTLPDHVKQGIKRGLQQAESGQVVPHETVMQKYAKYL